MFFPLVYDKLSSPFGLCYKLHDFTKTRNPVKRRTHFPDPQIL